MLIKNCTDFLKVIGILLVLDFDEKAAEVFQNLKSNKIRVGTMDLKIASITIANDAILVWRNLADFEQIPDFQVEDWTKQFNF